MRNIRAVFTLSIAEQLAEGENGRLEKEFRDHTACAEDIHSPSQFRVRSPLLRHFWLIESFGGNVACPPTGCVEEVGEVGRVVSRQGNWFEG